MRGGVRWHYCGVSAATHGPSAQSRGGPGLRPLAAAAVVGGVVLAHLALLGRWAEPGPTTGARPPAAATSVRTIPLVARPAPAAGGAVADVTAGAAAAVPSAEPAVARLAPGGVAPAEPSVTTTREPAAEPAPATAPSAAGADVPLYASLLPPPFEALFSLRRGAGAGRAHWRFATSGEAYELALQTQMPGRDSGHLRSEGRTGPWGLEPARFVEGRRGRDQRAVNFQRDAAGGGRIGFSGPSLELPLPPGVQDRLGWLLQLAAILEAEPALRQPGAEVSMWVVGPRGDADVWVFQVAGIEPAAGEAPALLALHREPRRPWDTAVRVWLDPQARHLPWRAVWRTQGPAGDAGGGVELQRESLAWR